MPKINVSAQAAKDSKGSGFEPIPAGKYNATIYNVEFLEKFGKGANGGPGYNVQYKITGPTFANRRLFDRVYLADKWASGSVNFRFFQFLRALGVDLPEKGEGEIDVPEPEEIAGEQVTLVVGIENDSYAWNKAGAVSGDEGKYTRNTIKAVNEYEEIEADEDDDFASDDAFDLG